jgi:hypothetical protein
MANLQTDTSNMEEILKELDLENGKSNLIRKSKIPVPKVRSRSSLRSKTDFNDRGELVLTSARTSSGSENSIDKKRHENCVKKPPLPPSDVDNLPRKNLEDIRGRTKKRVRLSEPDEKGYQQIFDSNLTRTKLTVASVEEKNLKRQLENISVQYQDKCSELRNSKILIQQANEKTAYTQKQLINSLKKISTLQDKLKKSYESNDLSKKTNYDGKNKAKGVIVFVQLIVIISLFAYILLNDSNLMIKANTLIQDLSVSFGLKEPPAKTKWYQVL